MSRADVAALWRQAQQQGLVPAEAELPEAAATRPWPVVLLTALGAWLAAIPLLLVAGLMFGSFFDHGGAYLGGVVLLGVAAWALRAAEVPLFVEQLAAPLLLAGGACLGYAWFKDLGALAAPLLLAALACGLGAWVRPVALQTCLGAAAAGFMAWAVVGWEGPAWRWSHPGWLSWLVCTLLWLASGAVWRSPAGPVAAMRTGWAALTLLGLALSSGLAMLVGSWVGGGGVGWGGAPWGPSSAGVIRSAGAVSAVLALAAAAWAVRAHPGLRRASVAGVALVLAALATAMPSLGAVLLIGAVAAGQGRVRLAAAAGLAVVWTISSFYYQLTWPLMTKAAGLAAAGAVLALLVAPGWLRVARGPAGPAAAAGPLRGLRIGALLSGVAVLVALNVGIAQKESLIASGQTVFVPLAPVDPRSLMQGDYMRLNFRPLTELAGPAGGDGTGASALVLTLDAQQVVQSARWATGAPVAPGEVRMNLSRKSGRWLLVTDAWFFKEGEGARWAAARFGEFRVTPDGQALLVGLRGENLAAL
ncbi:GDYXXLXY domain-containing protein [Roseateles sp. BYS87W]|uniref:GDYXXLXY domain-containing protein n=1 Tax=Pelomonas baiyunensis TaxID=3299026 RepID=A0ABW7H1C9_9BURK